jgi:opacity protein-like surface antigen
MKNFRKAIVVAAALTMGYSATASAADLLPPPPVMEPVPIPEPVPVHDIYLRGYIGATEQEADDFTNSVIAAGNFSIFAKEFDSSPFIGFGVGIRRSERLRFDLTGEYRAKSTFHGIDRNNTASTSNEYSGLKSDWLFLANGYVDLGTHRGFTPYVGAGIGVSEITLDNFTDTNENTGGFHWSEDNSEWNLAWALHAGFSYEISNDLTFDMGYRFTYLGDGETGAFRTYDPTPSPSPLKLEDITSHDVHIGLRWSLGGDDCCASDVMPIAYK